MRWWRGLSEEDRAAIVVSLCVAGMVALTVGVR